MNAKTLTFLCALPLAFLSLHSLASAETVVFKATLSGASEVPPTASTAKGSAVISVDTVTKVATYEITYSGFADAPKAAHIHGPAAAGANAGVMAPFTIGASPMKGTMTLTDAQIADVAAGKAYVNIHTTAFGGGEIRGQLAK